MLVLFCLACLSKTLVFEANLLGLLNDLGQLGAQLFDPRVEFGFRGEVALQRFFLCFLHRVSI